ncbi:MAG: T9SS type A sorting domain-containing protein [Bacteroidota bacterium]|nr:T9SS type A sorting domain-containing protein [Bacteroidota bacterium]MDX5430827.1 T9SS type A sorting domain-containing protein [Bacteroidota bacterium]
MNLCQAQVIVPESTISDSVSWNANQGVYQIQGNIYITESGFLRIGAGTQIRFEGNFGIFVSGGLLSSGINGSDVVIKGADIGNGQHLFWQGISIMTDAAILDLNNTLIHDAQIAINTTPISPLQPNINPIRLNFCTLENNLIGLKTGVRGIGLNMFNCLIANNDIGVEASLAGVDSLQGLAQADIRFCRIEDNRIGLKNISGYIRDCTLSRNDTAAYDIALCLVGENAFSFNGMAFTGHSISLENNSFFQNGTGALLTGRNESREKWQQRSDITSNYFQANGWGLIIQEGNRFNIMDCNLFFRNDSALMLPNSTAIGAGESFLLQRNVFAENSFAIRVTEQTQSFTPILGTNFERINLRYNTLFNNGNVLHNDGALNLNLLNNYMIASKANIETGILDGSDGTGKGMVNYTVSGDTSMAGDSITVVKIEDVIKHQDYDSLLYAGNTYYFKVCAKLPGNPLSVPVEPPAPESVVYPNPTQGNLTLEWNTEEEAHAEVYNSLGQKLLLPNTVSYSPMSIDLSHVPTGIYYVVLVKPSGVVSSKILKE